MPNGAPGELRQIPWDLIEKHERRADRNHGQTLEDLAMRGGLCATEAVAVLEDKGWYERWNNSLDATRNQEAADVLKDLVNQFHRNR